MQKKTLVLGASLKEARYSFKAINKLKENNIPVVALGLRKGKVAAIVVVTLYLNPKRQEAYYSYIINLQPKRVIFNPGTENTYFVKLLQENNIESEVACTLVLLSINQY